jgi:hypothetical protein
MSHSIFDDPTIPPPGKRTGDGTESILPYLMKSLATKPQVQPQPEDAANPVPQDPQNTAKQTPR